MSDIIDADPSKKIDHLLKTHIAPFLKAKNFKRKGRHFWRDHGRVIDKLDVQKSQWNDAHEATFYINLGLTWPEINDSTSIVFARLEGLIKHSPWVVSRNTMIDKLGEEIIQALTDHGIPWLEQCHDPKMSCEHLQKMNLTGPIETFKKIYRF